MKSLLTALGTLLLLDCTAQKTVDVTSGDARVDQNSFYTVNGTPFVNVKFVALVEGTPYYKDEWSKGVLVSETGQQYKNLSLKLDLYENVIHYMDEKGVEMVTVSPIQEVVLTDILGNNTRFIRASSLKAPLDSKSQWLHWLYSGTTSLYKLYDKKFYEQRPYNSATTEQHIKTSEKYLVLNNNVFLEIKKLKDAPSVLAGKKAELEEFLKTKDDKNAPMDDRFVALIEYYNSLLKEQK
jgi:hypothetical protein